jgi:DNA polymerase I
MWRWSSTIRPRPSATTIYPDKYKANRPEPPEDLRPQFPLTREATRAFNVACLEVEGYEADDIIATLARQAARRGGAAPSSPPDKDLMQLVGGGVEMFDPMKDRRHRPRRGDGEIRRPPEKGGRRAGAGRGFGRQRARRAGHRAEDGGPADQEYGDLDTLLARAGEIKQPKRREALIDNADQIRISRDLVTLKRDTPLDP